MILFLIITSIGLINCNEFTLSECPATEQYLKLSDVNLNPHPVVYPKNLGVGLNLDILKDIPRNTKVKVSARKTSPRQVSIPCVFGYGSCTYNYCELWKEMNDAISGTDLPECPMSAGKYSYQNLTIVMPQSSAIMFLKPLLKGDYTVDLTFLDDSTKKSTTIGCIQVKFTIQLDSAFKWNPESEPSFPHFSKSLK